MAVGLTDAPPVTENLVAPGFPAGEMAGLLRQLVIVGDRWWTTAQHQPATRGTLAGLLWYSSLLDDVEYLLDRLDALEVIARP
jgi:hypothetical protein